MKEKTLSLDLRIELAAWRRVPRLRARLAQAAQATLAHVPKELRLNASATVLLAGDAKVRQLNHDFRGIDKTTNVLSFPQFDPGHLPSPRRQKDAAEIGDIALAYRYTAREAKAEGKALPDHMTHLVIHGLLHLFGFDHMNGRDAATMESLETEIMASLGLPDPYAPPKAPATKKTKRKK